MKTFLASVLILLSTATASATGPTPIQMCGEFAIVPGQAPKIMPAVGPFASMTYNVFLLSKVTGASETDNQARRDLITKMEIGTFYCVTGIFGQLPNKALYLVPISFLLQEEALK